MTLTEKQKQIVAAALDCAAAEYAKHAAIPELPPRLVAQFSRQAEEATTLRHEIETNG